MVVPMILLRDSEAGCGLRLCGDRGSGRERGEYTGVVFNGVPCVILLLISKGLVAMVLCQGGEKPRSLASKDYTRSISSFRATTEACPRIFGGAKALDTPAP